MARLAGSDRAFAWRRVLFLAWLFYCIRFGVPGLVALQDYLHAYMDMQRTLPGLCGGYAPSSPEYAACHDYFMRSVWADILRDGPSPILLAIGIPVALLLLPFLLRWLRPRRQARSTMPQKVSGNGKPVAQVKPTGQASPRDMGTNTLPTVVRRASMRETTTVERRR